MGGVQAAGAAVRGQAHEGCLSLQQPIVNSLCIQVLLPAGQHALAHLLEVHVCIVDAVL